MLLNRSQVSISLLTTLSICFFTTIFLPTHADVIPDATLENSSVVSRESDRYQISGGTQPQNGPNLFHSFSEFSIGENRRLLEVQPRHTLALIGGDVFLPNGEITVRNGQIELGSVGGDEFVEVRSVARGWPFGYGAVEQFRSIKFDVAVVDGSGTPGGEDGSSAIQFQGQSIQLLGISLLSADSFGSVANVKIKASEEIYMPEGSSIAAEVVSSATGEGSESVSSSRWHPSYYRYSFGKSSRYFNDQCHRAYSAEWN